MKPKNTNKAILIIMFLVGIGISSSGSTFNEFDSNSTISDHATMISPSSTIFPANYHENFAHSSENRSDHYLKFNETENSGEIDANRTTSNNDLEAIEQYIFPKTWTWVLIAFHSLVFIIGIVGNILVSFAVYRNHSMRTVTNYFIVNLAVADFLVILFCLPPSVVWDVTMTWFFGVFMCKTVLYFQNAQLKALLIDAEDELEKILGEQSVSVTVSVLTLTFISIDRWYAICYPLKFKSTTNRAKTAIGLIWFISLVTAFPEMYYSSTRAMEGLGFETIYFTQCEPSWSKETDTYFTIIKMIFSYVIPLIFMTIAYVQIIRVLWKSGNVHNQATMTDGRNSFTMNMNTSTDGQIKSRRKAAKMLVVVVAMFAICYFPVHLLSVLRLTVGLKNSEANRAAAMISHWLCYANSAINPIIYNFMSGKYRKEFRRAFEHWFGDKKSYNSSVFYRHHQKTIRITPSELN